MDGDISSIITKIISNPEFAEMVKEMKGSDESAEEVQSELLGKLPEVLDSVSPLLGNDKPDSPKNEEREDGGREEKKGGKYDKSKAEKLMCALKPYLNEDRCRIIDRCLSVMQLSDVFGALGGIGGK